MTKKELMKQLNEVPDDFDIILEYADGSVGDFQLEPVTESCDKPDVVAIIIVPKEVKH
jgi:hypothetical protein